MLGEDLELQRKPYEHPVGRGADDIGASNRVDVFFCRIEALQ